MSLPRSRFVILGRLTGSAIYFIPLVWLGFPAMVVFAMLQLNLLYGFWIRATWIPKLCCMPGRSAHAWARSSCRRAGRPMARAK
jgi:hypothetical protein